MRTIDTVEVKNFLDDVDVNPTQTKNSGRVVCRLRLTTQCPGRRVQTPPCHDCRWAELDHDEFAQIAAQHGFTFDRSVTNSAEQKRITELANGQRIITLISSGSDHGDTSSEYGTVRILHSFISRKSP